MLWTLAMVRLSPRANPAVYRDFHSTMRETMPKAWHGSAVVGSFRR